MFSIPKCSALFLGLIASLPLLGEEAEKNPRSFAAESATFFKSYCVACHGEEKQKGNVTLHNIFPDFDEAETGLRWMDVLGQLESGAMPPEDERQPTHEERARLAASIHEQFRLAGTPVEQLRASPKYGNYVKHADLFSGEHEGPAYSRPRVWRISPYIDGKSSPFSLSQGEGFKDYAHMWSMDKPTIELLIMNADAVVKKQIGPSEADFKAQDVIWKQQLLSKRRDLKKQVAADAEKLAKDPDNASLVKKVENLRKQLEKNEATDFEKDRRRPSAKLAGLQKHPLWRIAYGEGVPSQAHLEVAVLQQLKSALRREPLDADIQRMAARLKKSIETYGNLNGMKLTLTSILLSPESIYRMELGLGEELPDGRRTLDAAETAYALGYALSDAGPDKEMLKDMASLTDRDVVRKHVERIYSSAITSDDKRKGQAERVLRFFQEYFAYGGATDVFKDGSRHPGHSPRFADLIKDTDMLILHVLKGDQDVLKTLLTTDVNFIRYVPTRPGWETVGSYNVTRKQAKENNIISGEKNKNGQRYVLQLAGQRAGILTQPSWLTAHSTNFDNDPVKRGKWVYEHLLGGIIPDLPVTVDATVPEDIDKTLRERFAKTEETYCQKCHAKMNPLGLAFEMFDDVGRYRDKGELLRDNKTFVPVDASGGVAESGVRGLDGSVDSAIELMDKLAESEHVRQVFVRHAFRYWMGRNETLDDSPTLMAADRAYVENGGSMKALVVSLLSSDSFLTRKDYVAVDKRD